MNETAFDQFILLVESDQQLANLMTEKVRFIKEQERLQTELDTFKKDLDEKDQVIYTLKKRIDAANLELKVVDAKVQEQKEKLENAANPKEYFSLEQEITAISSQRASHEEALFLLWQELEKAQAEQSKLLELSSTRTQVIEQELIAINRRLLILDKDIEQAQQDSSLYQKSADPDLVSTYRTMRQQAVNPVVPVKNNSCSACFYNIHPQGLQEIKRDKLITCKDCYRLLYAPRADKA